MSPQAVAVVGAGVLGRLLALQLRRVGHRVDLFEREAAECRSTCSFAAAGLLTPLSEGGASSEPQIVRLGLRSVALWRELLGTLPSSVVLGEDGSLMVARTPDLEVLLERFQRIRRRFPQASCHWLEADDVARLDPGLREGGFAAGVYLPEEGYIQSHAALKALQEAHQAEGVSCFYNTDVSAIGPHQVVTSHGEVRGYDLVLDCRGLAARDQLRSLRGVRGELIEVHAPEVDLALPLQVMHQRYPVYIVPRGGGIYAIGATCLESESMAPVSVKAVLELLTAAYSAHPGFRFAAVQRLVAHCRPAFPDHLPRLHVQDGLWQVNGLYRHGFLLAPVVTMVVLKQLNSEPLSDAEAALIHGPCRTTLGAEDACRF